MRPLPSILVPPLLLLLLLTSGAAGQSCLIGSYADDAGSVLQHEPALFAPFLVYIVLRVESAVTGMAYSIAVPEQLLFSALDYGPSGIGINVPREGGENVGLGECALGFNGTPIVIARYQAIALEGMAGGLVELGPNTDEDPQWPIYASCADQLLTCDSIEELTISPVVANESRSIGYVKALYAQ